jgi:hypothetical protein
MHAANDLDEAERWFLKADDGRSTIRIVPGLSLAEDEQGEVVLDHQQRPESLVRFDVEDGELWLSVVAPAWTLRGCGQLLGERMRAQPQMELRLPNNRFTLTTNLSSASTGGTMNLRLVPRTDAEPTSPPFVPRHQSSPAEPAADQQPDSYLQPDASAARSPPDQHRPSAWRWLMPDRPEPDAAAPAPWPSEPTAHGPLPATRATTPAAARHVSQTDAPARRSPSHRQAARRPMSPAARRAYARTRRPRMRARLGYGAVMAAIALAVLLITPPVNTPVQDDLVMHERLLASAREPVQPMLDEVEALLQGDRINDPASLQFAVEAYRTAVRYGHHDPAQADRLAELERRLKRVANTP